MKNRWVKIGVVLSGLLVLIVVLFTLLSFVAFETIWNHLGKDDATSQEIFLIQAGNHDDYAGHVLN